MDYIDQAVKYAEKADEWQAKIGDMEAKALVRAKAGTLPNRTHAGPSDKPEYDAAADLAANFWYKRAIGNRDACQKQAVVYASVALALSNQALVAAGRYPGSPANLASPGWNDSISSHHRV